jgi:hypothetical protein
MGTIHPWVVKNHTNARYLATPGVLLLITDVTHRPPVLEPGLPQVCAKNEPELREPAPFTLRVLRGDLRRDVLGSNIYAVPCNTTPISRQMTIAQE